jgi:hypothetical protein
MLQCHTTNHLKIPGCEPWSAGENTASSHIIYSWTRGEVLQDTGKCKTRLPLFVLGRLRMDAA